ncbi:MAG: BamA/TamA family outer membrane protein [Bacteriovoracaceae bacterium]|nr:BamA/TamA family outer membrane protein [Bacteriovoracaceae bacterium]
MRKLLSCLLIQSLLLFQVQVAFAETNDDFIIEKITYLTDKGDQVDLKKIQGEIKTKAGEVLNSEYLTDDIQLFMKKLPQYEHVAATIEPGSSEGKVYLNYTFQKKRVVRIVRIMVEEGGSELDGLLDGLATKKGRVFRTDTLERDKEYLRKTYVRAGYPKVRISHKLKEARREKDLEVQFHVIPGSRKVRVKKVNIYGNFSIGTDVLKDVMETRTRSWFLASHPNYNDFSLEEDLEAVLRHYKDNGFLDVRLRHELDLQDNKYAWISIFVDEGRRYRVHKVDINGPKAFDKKTVLELSGLHRTKYFSERDLRQGLQKIRKHYGRHGYALVQTLSSYDPVNGVLGVYVQEGEKQYINDIKVEGQDKMKPERILLDVKFEKGDLVNIEKIQKTLGKMKATGYYADVKIDYIPKEGENKGTLLIQVKEAGTQFISFGFGASTSGPSGQFGYGNNNLFGSGLGLSIQAMKSEEVTRLGLIFSDPHLFGSDFELEARADYVDRAGAQYDEQRIRTRIMIEKAINEQLKLGFGARFEFVTLDDMAEGYQQQNVDVRKETRIIGMISTLVYKNETRDSAGDIKKGHRIKLALLPSYSDEGAYIKAFTEIVGAVSLGENSSGASHTLSGRITLGYASDKAPVFEKFYAGGIGTIRGFESRSITPNGNGVGANALVSMNASYSFPLIKNRIKGVIFIEAASVGTNFSSMDGLRAVGGLGIRANLRDTFLGTSIEAGYAHPLIQQDGDRLKPFYFMFGEYDPAYDL